MKRPSPHAHWGPTAPVRNLRLQRPALWQRTREGGLERAQSCPRWESVAVAMMMIRGSLRRGEHCRGMNQRHIAWTQHSARGTPPGALWNDAVCCRAPGVIDKELKNAALNYLEEVRAPPSQHADCTLHEPPAYTLRPGPRLASSAPKTLTNPRGRGSHLTPSHPCLSRSSRSLRITRMCMTSSLTS